MMTMTNTWLDPPPPLPSGLWTDWDRFDPTHKPPAWKADDDDHEDDCDIGDDIDVNGKYIVQLDSLVVRSNR